MGKDSSAGGFTKVIHCDPKVQKENAMLNNVKVSVNGTKSVPSLKINTHGSGNSISQNGQSKSTSAGHGSTTLTPTSKHLATSPLSVYSSTSTTVTKTANSISPNKNL